MRIKRQGKSKKGHKRKQAIGIKLIDRYRVRWRIRKERDKN